MSRYQQPLTTAIRCGLRVPRMATALPPNTSGLILEQDQHPNYNPKKYYPAHIGETVSDRYNIISKLGWGVNSTVWLAKDTRRLVCLHSLIVAWY